MLLNSREEYVRCEDDINKDDFKASCTENGIVK